MLLNDDEHAPLKAIDFGLAVFFEPDKLPRTDLGLEGTPWCVPLHARLLVRHPQMHSVLHDAVRALLVVI